MVSKTTLLSIVTLVAVNNTSAVNMPTWLSSAVTSAKGYLYTTQPVTKEVAVQTVVATPAPTTVASTVKNSLLTGVNTVKGYALTASNAVSAQASACKTQASALLNSARAITLNDVKGAVLSKQGAQVGAAAVIIGTAVYYKDEIKNAFKAGYNKIASFANHK